MQILLHILAGIAGALLLYIELFLYEGEDRRKKNRLEQIWQEIHTLQARALSKEMAFLRVAASSTSTALDFLLGKKLLSMRAVTISVVFSLASTLVWLIVLQHAGAANWSLMVLFCWLLLILGSLPACAQSDSTAQFLQRVVVTKIYWFGVAAFAVVSQLFILYRLLLGTLDNGLATFPILIVILSFKRPFVLVLAFVAVELSILVAVMTDIFFLVLFRWVLTRAAGLSQFSAVVLYFLLTIIVAALLAGPGTLLAVPSLSERLLVPNFGVFAVAYMVSTSAYIDVACLQLFVCFMVLLLLHRLIWPVGKRLFDYTAIRRGLIKKMKVLGGVGVMLLLYALPTKQDAPPQSYALGIDGFYGGTDFHGIFFQPRRSRLGWVVGEEGTILHTEDGGGKWMRQASGTTQYLASVAFASAQLGWAVGMYGGILRTVDGGKTWSAQASGTKQHLTAVSFVDTQDGWAVGEAGTILHTDDGGQRWSLQTSGTREIVLSVTSTTARSAWAVGTKGTILHTDDGGQRWSTQTSGTREALSSVAFVSGQEGWTVGSVGTILHTVDGGKTWSVQASGTKQDLTAVSFVDTQDGWAVGGAGTILHTDDGHRWSAQASPRGAEHSLSAVMFVSKQEGWAVGMGKTMLHTENGGRTWRLTFH